jgi:hypothetical protein
MAVSEEAAVSGDIFIQSQDEEGVGTLDEPISTTLARDVKAIFRKFVHVLVPVRSNKALLHDWDLWGPLFLCMTLSLLLHGRSSDGSHDENTIHFVHVFLLVWGGAGIVTLNAQLLKGKVSFFQSVCTLGYCLLPLALVLLLSRILLSFHSLLPFVFVIKMALIGVALAWSIWASLGFLSDYLAPDRRALAIYPIVLFYLSISCLIATQKYGLL